MNWLESRICFLMKRISMNGAMPRWVSRSFLVLNSRSTRSKCCLFLVSQLDAPTIEANPLFLAPLFLSTANFVVALYHYKQHGGCLGIGFNTMASFMLLVEVVPSFVVVGWLVNSSARGPVGRRRVRLLEQTKSLPTSLDLYRTLN